MSTFFVSWELWQQMTFCLGAVIALVFVAGYMKLFWTNRYLKKQEVIDEEKRAHIEEMRKTGLPANNKVFEIPFGVRAIQSGIQVDGIWISRPTSPAGSHSRLVTTSTLASEQENSKGKGLDTTASTPAPSSRRIPSDGSNIEQPLGSKASTFHTDISLSQAPRTYRPPPPQRLSQNQYNIQEDAMKQLEGMSTMRLAVQTYVPTTASNAGMSDDSGRVGDRSSVSSSDYETPDTSKPFPTPLSIYQINGPQHPIHQPSGNTQAPRGFPPNYSNFMHDSNNRSSSNLAASQTPSPENRNPFVSPEPRSSLEPGVGQVGVMECQEQVPQPMMPSPTFAPGDMHANRSRRSVNPGFEVLPAGTFGTRQNSSGDETDSDSAWRRRNRPRTSSLGGRAKLQKNQPTNARP